MGGKTEAARKQFERDHDLPPRGAITDAILVQLTDQVARLREQDARLAAQERERLSQPTESGSTDSEDVPAATPMALQPPADSAMVATAAATPAEPASDARRAQIVQLHGPEFADQILAGDIVAGMTQGQAFAARGEASRKEVIPPDDELWYYEDERVVIYKGEVSHVEQFTTSDKVGGGNRLNVAVLNLSELQFERDGGCSIGLTRPGEDGSIFYSGSISGKAAMLLDGTLHTFQRTSTKGGQLPYGQHQGQDFVSLDGKVKLAVELMSGEAPKNPEAEYLPFFGTIIVTKLGRTPVTLPVSGYAGC